MIEKAMQILLLGWDVPPAMMHEVMEEIMTGQAETGLIVSFLELLSNKRETIEELTAAAKVMRHHVTKIKSKHKLILDTCGTGGDIKGTFNISTVVAFVAAGSGIPVAKHGNRSVSSLCGSADILEASGINIHLRKERLQKCLDAIGIAFLFAQDLHPAMKYAMPARRQIGTKTMFNILGPLTNPAGATHQLIGVYDAHWTEVVAHVLVNLNSEHALVVHGKDGLDEITTTAKTKISEVIKNEVKNYEISPEDFGFKRAKMQDLAGKDAKTNAKIMLEILNGSEGPRRDIVLLNAAAAIYAADKAASIKEGIALAVESIDSGKALEKFNKLKEFTAK